MLQWESWSAFWSMGGRGWFVWGSYGVTLLCIIWELLSLKRRREATLRRLKRLARLRAPCAEPSSKGSAN